MSHMAYGPAAYGSSIALPPSMSAYRIGSAACIIGTCTVLPSARVNPASLAGSGNGARQSALK
jgi:hypothetical protein